MSQHESVKSSLGPDSQSMFSHGSGAPMLSPSSSTAPQLPPNKLVKRSSASNGTSPGSLVRRSSKSQLPTLRRPATSHQRSATLHQLTTEPVPPVPKFSFDQQARPRAQTLAYAHGEPAVETPFRDNTLFKSFFHARLAQIAMKPSPKRGDGSPQQGAKRICTEHKGHERAYLIKARSGMAGSTPNEAPFHIQADTSAEIEQSPQSSNKTDPSPAATPSKGPRRSISMQFSSPTNWISKTGSLRRRKRGPGVETASKRHVSDPVSTMPDPKRSHMADKTRTIETRQKEWEPSRAESELAAIFQPPFRRRNSTSPLPPLSRLSSFHVDLNRVGSPPAGGQARPDEVEVAGNSASTLRVNSNTSQARTLDRASTVASSDYHRDFILGDDDDTDFKTDTPFDSLRTVASGRRRTLDSPIESMFDESPPSTAGNNKQPKRLSIQEILGPSFDGGNKIMEEDEGLPTPVRGTYDDAEVHFRLANLDDEEGSFRYTRVSSDFPLPSRDFGRLSFDDDDDMDWTREDEVQIGNQLSPPSSMGSRRGSPNLRTALSTISGNGNHDTHRETSSERPRSNIFDWVEAPHHEKHEGEGNSPRPKTVHGKQELDMRGGRSASRKGPTAAHVRSQSVPIVPDLPDPSKSTPKFGTWGLGSKNVSEDWDDDFEFEEEMDVGPSPGKNAGNRLSMLVPASIQATQPTVKAHSGQIRELSLLVNDLKRLCRLGRDMEMLNGSSATLWRDAEGIIALASPDEDVTETVVASVSADAFDPTLIDERFIDEGFDGGALAHPEPSGRAHEQMKTAVVKDRPLARRRSVFSPEDDIFGNWPHTDDEVVVPARPRTPEPKVLSTPYNPASVARSLMESMQLRRRRPSDDDDYDEEGSSDRLNFDTNSLKELVKRASDLRDALSDLVRRADHITQSPARTPRRDRGAKNEDGSPAFTRVFDEPASSPSRRLPQSRSSNSVLSGAAISASPSNGLSQRMQMMTVS